MGFKIRPDSSGITSFNRGTRILPKHYQRVLDHFHSNWVNLEKLTQLWIQLCLRILVKNLEVVNGKIVLLVEGIKIGKEGMKMPGVKLLHQQSENNTKAEYIIGNSIQAVSLLVKAAKSYIPVPLVGRIHKGFITSNRNNKTLIDKIIELLNYSKNGKNFYFVADA